MPAQSNGAESTALHRERVPTPMKAPTYVSPSNRHKTSRHSKGYFATAAIIDVEIEIVHGGAKTCARHVDEIGNRAARGICANLVFAGRSVATHYDGRYTVGT
jgi:hypothetical protein